ncbi:MAG TPA: hypothetical protein VLK85_24150 [Ramlibacter sp.]|nr:hypothetical protein [Ramlibacter sp.]
MQDPDDRKDREPSEFLDAMKKGVLLGLAVLAIVIPVTRMRQAQTPPAQPPVATAPQPPAAGLQPAPGAPEVAQQGPDTTRSAPGARMRLADFGGEEPSPQARLVANWAVHSRDHKKNAFVIVDKAEARVYVFTPAGKLMESAPALLGSAHGDYSVPGIGDKPLSAIKPDEKTTPAGRFVAQPGLNTKGEDIIWVDYDAAVSMHRIRPLVAKERRLERLATLTVDDNRISFGCINLPVTFYESVLSPTVRKYGAIVYVLPETRPPEKLFGTYDPLTQQVAQKQARRA